MTKYSVTVIRKQKWAQEFESDGDEKDAALEAEHLCENEPPHNDFAYSTEVEELE